MSDPYFFDTNDGAHLGPQTSALEVTIPPHFLNVVDETVTALRELPPSEAQSRSHSNMRSTLPSLRFLQKQSLWLGFKCEKLFERESQETSAGPGDVQGREGSQ